MYVSMLCTISRYPKNVIKIGSQPEPDFVPMDGEMGSCIVTEIDPFRHLSLFVKVETFHDSSCYIVVYRHGYYDINVFICFDDIMV